MPLLPSLPAVPSYSDMVAGATAALGSPGSLFKNPAQVGINSVSTIQTGINYLMSQVQIYDPTYVPPTYTDPTTGTIMSLGQHITSAISGITSAISSKLSSLGSELSKIQDASNHEETIKSVDSILNKNLAGVPSQISAAYPGLTPPTVPTTMDVAFKPLTGANDHVSGAASTMSAEFNNTGFMVPFFTALNNIPGITQLVTVEDLLTYIGTTVDKTNINAAFAIAASSGGFINGLESAFGNVGTHTTTMSSGFNDIMSSANSAVSAASSLISGSFVMSLLTDTSPQITAITDKIIDKSAINQQALQIKTAIDNKEISLPGTESLAISNPANVSLPDVNSTGNGMSAASIISPPPAAPSIVSYTVDEINAFTQLVSTAHDENDAAADAAALWAKTNIEDWKISVGYNDAKLAAGYTKESPYGTSTNQAALDAWKPLLEEQRRRLEYYNNTYFLPNKIIYNRFIAMRLEWARRVKYGKYPYTIMNYNGIAFTPEEETILLDTTK